MRNHVESLTVTEIGAFRDGGTIVFRIKEPHPLAGKYRLRTPFAGEPQPIFRDEVQLELGSKEEAALSSALKHWLDLELSPVASAALRDLDELKQWRNVPDRLNEVVPLHRIREVIHCLDARQGA